MPDSDQGHRQTARILLVDRDVLAAQQLLMSLGGALAAPPQIELAMGGRSAIERLRAARFDLVLVDLLSLADLCAEPEEGMTRLVRLAGDALVVALSDGASVTAAMGAMRGGAHDYIVRSLAGRAFADRIREIAERHGKARTLAVDGFDTGAVGGFAGLVGASSQMQAVYEQIERSAQSTAPVFITGEPGTGKDLCAEALHQRSPRSGRRLVTVDCTALQRNSVEGELFGIARGAIAGVEEDRKGAAELADGGTLFLDEIGALDLSVQGKLLRLLQSGTITRLGEASARRVDVRLICATAHNPMQLIADRRFREDLFYRLHVLPIHLPPLRQRPLDIPDLARHFLSIFSLEEHKSFTGLSGEAIATLMARDWPGNVLELEELIRRVVVMQPGGEVTAEMVAFADLGVPVAPRSTAAAPAAGRLAVLPMWQQEQRIIEQAIESFGGNVALAAQALELSPSTIYRKRQAWAEMDENRGAA